MMRFAELAAPFFETAEIIELHHDQKIDAPVGHGHDDSAADGRRVVRRGPPIRPARSRSRRARAAALGPAGIHVHSVRLRGLVAHQEVLLGTTGQSLTDPPRLVRPRSFMPGVLLAVKAVADRPGVTVGLDAVLGL